MSRVKKEEEEASGLEPAPESQDFKLTSAASWLQGKRFSALKFGNAGSWDPSTWRQPVKLNRRTELALRQMEEGEDGVEEEEVAKRRAFQRKTTRIMHSEENKATLAMRREERNPWLLEDASPSTSAHAQRWTGRVEGTLGTGTDSTQAAKSHYVFLVLDKQTNDFKVVPAHRIYNFTKRPNRNVLGAEQADLEFQRRNRNFWSMHSRNDSNSPSGRARVKVELPDTHRALGKAVKKEKQTLKERKLGERKMKAVADRSLFGSDDEDRKPGKGDDQDFEEFDFEEDVQDDEEGAGMEADDANDEEENRRNEERRKKELREANRSASEPESDTDKRGLDSMGKKAKKLMRKMGRTEYESDDDADEDNPYAPDRKTSSDEDTPNNARPSTSRKDKRKKHGSHARGPPSARPSLPGSRAGSPSPSLTSGSAAVARRATSPHAHTPRAGSPGASKRKADDSSRGSGSKRARTATPLGGEISDADIIEFLKKAGGAPVPIVDVLKYSKKTLGFDVKSRAAELQLILDRIGVRNGGAITLKPAFA